MSARVAQADQDGTTALHSIGDIEVGRLLLASGADVNAKVSIASGYRLLQPPLSGWLAFNGTG